MLPETLRTVDELEELLSRPSEQAVRAFAAVPGDVLILGAGGKMGPTLARMAVRASEAAGTGRRVVAVSRFGDPASREPLEACGVETIAGDLLDPAFVASLPEAPNVVFMAGMKFGSTGAEATTWAMNTHLPALVCQRFSHSRLVAFSTGNVYGLVPRDSGGSAEADAANPVGEYAMSCLGRERIVQYFSERDQVPAVLIRLNYATELRYGVLVDLAKKIADGEPVDLTMGYVNVIWQGDASALTLSTLPDCGLPPTIVNVAGPDVLHVRNVCERLAERMGTVARFVGEESDRALLNDGRRAHARYGEPAVSIERLLDWTADWVQRGGPTLGKPTRFESRDGKF